MGSPRPCSPEEKSFVIVLAMRTSTISVSPLPFLGEH
jgi:hypothetical protein